MPVGRLFLSYISCNVGSHGQVHENLPVLMLSLFCISRNFLTSDFSSQWDPDRAEESFEVWRQWLYYGSWRREDKGTGPMPSGVMGLLVWVASMGEGSMQDIKALCTGQDFILPLCLWPSPQGSEYSNLLKITELMDDRTWIWTCTPRLLLQYLSFLVKGWEAVKSCSWTLSGWHFSLWVAYCPPSSVPLAVLQHVLWSSQRAPQQ